MAVIESSDSLVDSSDIQMDSTLAESATPEVSHSAASDSNFDVSPAKSRPDVFGRRHTAVGCAFLATLFALVLPYLFTEEADDIVCPQPRRIATGSRRSTAVTSPAELLAEAQHLLEPAGNLTDDPSATSKRLAISFEKARIKLEACVSWTAPQMPSGWKGGGAMFDNAASGPKLPIGDLRALLQCRSLLLDRFVEADGPVVPSSSKTQPEEIPSSYAEALAAEAALAAGDAVDTGAEEVSASVASYVGGGSKEPAWASAVETQTKDLLQHAQVTLKRCSDITREIQTSRRQDSVSRSPGPAIATLSMLGNLQPTFSELLGSFKLSHDLLGRLDDTSVNRDVLSSTRTDLRGCLLRAVREARAIAGALPLSSLPVRRAAKCIPDMLAGIEALALREAEKDSDPAVHFALGMHHSEIAVTVGAAGSKALPVPLFSTVVPPVAWGSDSDGLEIPVAVVVAEEILLRAEQASSGTSATERAVLRAKRLCQHAEGILMPLGLHDAVESRFRAAAVVFNAHSQPKIASRTLSDLGQYLLKHGSHEESLHAVTEALVYDDQEPVALYLHATLRRSLGQLNTDEDVQKAENQLKLASGKLPSKELEARRASSHAELLGWGAIAASADWRVCLELHDSARVMICLACWLTYA